MRLIMAQLIGYVRGWGKAKASGKNGWTYFAGNSLFQIAALALLAYQTGKFSCGTGWLFQ
ncbi:hypothetical protein DXT99_23190 [Pontibacter diazotrophicus]|uniref:Uncharacterized protein n=2 Tax=Pontibacter diazotrophicus TaxID=1400979 RepID=A0A3D8L3D8_9BACT|nr:hypothetical protein DXT99_23190 [Pontibacter diazotrophicus]